MWKPNDCYFYLPKKWSRLNQYIILNLECKCMIIYNCTLYELCTMCQEYMDYLLKLHCRHIFNKTSLICRWSSWGSEEKRIHSVQVQKLAYRQNDECLLNFFITEFNILLASCIWSTAVAVKELQLDWRSSLVRLLPSSQDPDRRSKPSTNYLLLPSDASNGCT